MARPADRGGIALDYDRARALLAEAFAAAERAVAAGSDGGLAEVAACGAKVFASASQSYREALLGCALARGLDPHIDIRLPYAAHGPRAFNGRTLDERVVNPFLKERSVPSSKGPYLAAFRRSVRYVPATGDGLRDRGGFEAMLAYLAVLEAADGAGIAALLRDLCMRFVRLRDRSRVPLVRLIRMSLDQQGAIVAGLLASRSGGRFPVFITAAMLEALRDSFALPWTIAVQGINAADAASGASGDIVVRDSRNDTVVIAVEVTERPIDKNRIVGTFTSKIAIDRITEYLFLYTDAEPDAEARRAAFGYFAQGHDILFLRIEEWVRNCLGIVGAAGREGFIQRLLDHLDTPDVPSALKQRWNELAGAVAAGTPPG